MAAIIVAIGFTAGVLLLDRAPGVESGEPATMGAQQLPGEGEPDAALTPEPLPPLPELDASDAFVRRLAATLSAHPRLAAWLATDALVRRFVLVTSNVAVGVNPQAQLRFMAPEGSFTARDSGETLLLDPTGFSRYDGLTAAIVSLDVEGAAELYRRLEPLMEEAHRDLGLGAGFEATLRRAIARLLEVRVPEGPIELVPDGAVYAFADPSLEELTAAQKTLVRAGPQHARQIQAKLRELAAALDIEVPPAQP